MINIHIRHGESLAMLPTSTGVDATAILTAVPLTMLHLLLLAQLPPLLLLPSLDSSIYCFSVNHTPESPYYDLFQERQRSNSWRYMSSESE